MNSHSALIGLICDDALRDRISFCLPFRVIYERVQRIYGRIAIRPYTYYLVFWASGCIPSYSCYDVVVNFILKSYELVKFTFHGLRGSHRSIPIFKAFIENEFADLEFFCRGVLQYAPTYTMPIFSVRLPPNAKMRACLQVGIVCTKDAV